MTGAGIVASNLFRRLGAEGEPEVRATRLTEGNVIITAGDAVAPSQAIVLTPAMQAALVAVIAEWAAAAPVAVVDAAGTGEQR